MRRMGQSHGQRGAYSQKPGWESIEDTGTMAMEQSKKCQPVIWKRWKGTRVGTPKSQAC